MALRFILAVSAHIACYRSPPQAQAPLLDATRNARCPTTPVFEPRGAAPQLANNDLHDLDLEWA
jgi:hypothetical protein